MMQLRGFDFHFLPEYSPFFNPIECLFSEWKSFIRSQKVNNQNELDTAITAFEVTPIHTANYFQHVTNNCIRCIQGDDPLLFN